jgi:uncharacterized protein YggT (Ycf19 family)
MDVLLLILYKALQYYYYILVASVLLSWIPDLKRSTIGRFIDKLANPYMRIFRGWIVIGVMDFTPILGFMFYYFGMNAVGQMLTTI